VLFQLSFDDFWILPNSEISARGLGKRKIEKLVESIYFKGIIVAERSGSENKLF